MIVTHMCIRGDTIQYRLRVVVGIVKRFCHPWNTAMMELPWWLK